MADEQVTTIPEPDAPVAPPPPAPPRRPAFLPLVAGGLIAAALGYGAAQVWPLVAGQDPALQAQVQALQDQVAKLSEAPGMAQALADRVATLEKAAPPDLAPLLARIEAAEQALQQLKLAPAGVDPMALAALQLQIDALKQGGVPQAALADVQAAFDARLAEASQQIAQVKAEAEAIAQASQRRAGLLQLQAALDSGAPYQAALQALSGLEIPEVLAQHDASGLPRLQDLRQTFPEAARAGLDAALRANMGESWADRVRNFLLNQTGARSLTPREGTDPDAILSRAEAALAQGDLALVLSESAALPPEALAAMEVWLAQARLRAEAFQAVQSLSDAAGL